MQIEQLRKDMMAAMKAHDKERKRCDFLIGIRSEEKCN